MLELQNLIKPLPLLGVDVVRALDGLSMSVDAGELVALYSGSSDR